ncbi:MAG TPA: DUF4292 domain-containing protein [Flavobacteriales bacterium]|nr:DUF4292 domain-containing protein [Flavobacteriales bacterium]HRD51046.1 DUF4292 domain-containing protein [Flavobacteriales bacterium]
MMRWAIALLLPALIATACKGRRAVSVDRELPVRSAERVLERALAMRQSPTRYYSAKADVELSMPDEKRSFKAHLRSVHDSAMWVSVVPLLGIEAARVMLTADSLKIMDRINDQYFAGDTGAVRKRFGLVPDLALLQRALNGEAIALDSTERYRVDREEGHYVLTSREKRRFIRAAEDISPGDTLARDRDMRERRLERTLRKAEEREAIVHRYHLEPDSFRVARVQVMNLVNDRTAELRYEERGGPEMNHLPTRIRITLSEPGRLVSALLTISRIDLDGPVQMNFRIPEKYEPMP